MHVHRRRMQLLLHGPPEREGGVLVEVHVMSVAEVEMPRRVHTNIAAAAVEVMVLRATVIHDDESGRLIRQYR